MIQLLPNNWKILFLMLSYFLVFFRIIIGLVFAWSFLKKVQAISSFTQTINRFKLLPRGLHLPAAVVFLGCEFVIVGTMILGGKFLWWGFLLAASLLIFFSIALISLLTRKIQTSCNCFGTSSRDVSFSDVVRNIGFVGCALAGWVVLSVNNMPTALTLPEIGITSFVAVAFMVIWTHLAEIVELFHFA